MKTNVFAFIDSQRITVDEESLYFTFSIPNGLPANLKTVMWLSAGRYGYYLNDGSFTEFDPTQENYDKWIQPFVDLWQAEKDRIEAEQEVAMQELLKFENRKERALDLITADYHDALEKGFVRTSLGFDADISPDSVATLSATNIALARNLFAEETPKTIFRDFYGLKRELDQVQVELLICQINAAQNHIRELKYAFKTAIKETVDNDGLNAALDSCVYSTLDFTNLDESGKPAVLPFTQTYSLVDRIDARYR